MSTAPLSIMQPAPKPQPIKPKKKRSSSRRSVARMSAVEQVRRAFAPGQRLPAVMGFALGGIMPAASYTLVHAREGVASNPLLWILVAGGLLYSAPSVFNWARQAFQGQVKALGFVILIEGVATFARIHWISYAGLAVLVAINGISAAVALQVKTIAKEGD